MSDPKDKKPDPGKTPGETDADKSSGRVAFDARGNPVWEWQTSTGVYGREVSTQRLKKLEAKDLAILETPPTSTRKKPDELSLAEPQMPTRGTGFNPYDSSPVAGSKARVADEPRKPKTDLRKLDQWIKLKKSLKDDKK